MKTTNFFSRFLSKVLGGNNRHSNFMDESPDIITLHVKNTNPSTDTFSVFGQNFKGGQPPGVSVTVPESSLGQATRESVFRTFRIKKMKVTTTDVNNFSTAFYIVTKDMTGKEAKYPMQLTNWISPQNPNTRVIESEALNIPIWGDVGITGEIVGNSTMDVLLYTSFEDKKFEDLRKEYKKYSGYLGDRLQAGTVITGSTSALAGGSVIMK